MSLEVLFNCERCNIRRPQDAVICSIHFCMTANGYKCIGSGEVVPTGSVKKSDMLPAGWSDGSDSYSLMYQPADPADSTTLILKVICFDDQMLVHLLRTDDDKATSLEVNHGDYVTTDVSTFDSAFKDAAKLEERLKVELLEPLVTKIPASSNSSPPSASRSTADSNSQPGRDLRDPLRVPPRQPVMSDPYGQHWDPMRDPFAVGRSDLDPLHTGMGGGMLFDPFRSGRGGPEFGGGLGGPSLPRGAVIPGARFDPFGPPDIDLGGNVRPSRSGSGYGSTHPDLMKPPGFGDNMFM